VAPRSSSPARVPAPAQVRTERAARSAVRSIRRRFQDLQHRRAGLPVPPWRLRAVVLGDFWNVGEEFRGYLITLGGLQPDDGFLEIGSHAGRMAIPLTQYLSAKGSYEGTDDSEEATEWCARAFAEKYPNFSFRRFEDKNMPGSRLPYEDGAFDFVMFGSIAGLEPEAFLAYTREAARVLRVGGTYFATWYMVTGDVVSPMHPAIASTESSARRTLDGVGLAVESVYRGSWDGYQPAYSYQDIIVARKV
jgi:SAM-dependent methyltransferase